MTPKSRAYLCNGGLYVVGVSGGHGLLGNGMFRSDGHLADPYSASGSPFSGGGVLTVFGPTIKLYRRRFGCFRLVTMIC